MGDPIPYRVILTYHNETFVQSKIKTTIHLGAYQKLTELTYSQSDKLLLSVTPDSGAITDIVPTTTVTSSDGVDYNRYNVISGEKTATGIAKFVDSSLNKVGINKLLALYVDDVTKFTKSHFIAVVGTCSNTSKITQGSCSPGTWTASGKQAKIFSIDTTYGILYVENISENNKTFSTGDKISSDASGSEKASYITEVDDSYIMNDTNIDNDELYFSSKFKVTNLINVYQTGASYTIKPISPIASASLSVNNGVTYRISPALPAGLLLDSSSGVISGAFNSDLSPTLYTITASNQLGPVTTSFTLSSITAPLDYSITNKQIITVTNTALFLAGEDLFQPIAPPLTQASSARILKILNGNQMAIEVFNGTFLAGAVLDSGSTYISQKATIIPDNSCTNSNFKTKATCVSPKVWSPGPIYYNIALTVHSATSPFAATGDIIFSDDGNSATSEAKGIVSAIIDAADDTLFVQYLTQDAESPSAARTFKEGDTVKNGSVSATIEQVENSYLKLTLSANNNLPSTGFVKGADVVSNAGSSAYTYEVDGTTISVSDITTTVTGFKIDDILYNHELITRDGVVTNPDIDAITFDNLLVFERGKQSDFHGNISAGNGITYSITPALPPGLTLDTAKGSISGTPLSSMERNDFLITATNFISSVSFTTSIEVRDYFEIADKSATTSFRLHKVGDSQVNRKCRVNASDINNPLTHEKILDVRCYLDGEEEDIHFNKLKLNGLSGPGVCEYVQYEPYFFQQFSPLQSNGTSIKPGGYPTPVTVQVGCRSNDVPPPTVDLCDSYYTTNAHPEYPNCDEGYLRYTEETYIANGAGVCPADGSPTTKNTDKRVYCGGMMAKCTAGPITNLLSLDAIQSGKRGEIYNAPSGFNKTWEISAPIEKGYFTNIANANGSVVNMCNGDNPDTDTLENTTALQSGYLSPRGSYADDDKASLSNPFYTFYCLDAAREIKARIRLTVRDWDRSFNITSAIDEQRYSVLPPLMNDNTNDARFNTPWNSYKDWDDAYNGAVASYSTSCGVHTAATCSGTLTQTSKYMCELNGNTWTPTLGSSWEGSCGATTIGSEYICKRIDPESNTWTRPGPATEPEYKFPEGKL